MSNIPDLRKPSAPKRLEWEDNEVSNTVVHGLLIQVAVSLQGVVTFTGGQPIARLTRVAEDGPQAARYDNLVTGETILVSVEEAEEACRTAYLGNSAWRGPLDISERTTRAWKRHNEMWRTAHPVVAMGKVIDVREVLRGGG